MIKFSGMRKEWNNLGAHDGGVFSSKEFNGAAEYEIPVGNGKPSRVEIDSSFEEGELAHIN